MSVDYSFAKLYYKLIQWQNISKNKQSIAPKVTHNFNGIAVNIHGIARKYLQLLREAQHLVF